MVTGPEEVDFERRVLRAFEEVLDAPEGERDGLIAGLRTKDERLAAEVVQLLNVDRDAAPFELHDLPPVDQLAPLPMVQMEPGQRVGGYELVRPIGSGGMGYVFEALQERPRRSVALKMLRFGLDSASARRRFEVESEILARLRHPGIAQIYEAGVHREESVTGLREIPYFALEFVEGARTIVDYAREEELALHDVLELFVLVCDAVHHGHQRGVIHRDVKPANVLVGSEGVPKVIDFGVARAGGQGEEKHQHTRTSQLVGTLSAMSPEQLAGDSGDLDLRCDVYALGVILYELLSGRLPYDLERLPLHEATRRIVEEAPRSLAEAVPGLPRELETICLTAQAKDRADRYSSALDLAEDVRRFLRHEPIRAQPVGVMRRAMLYASRNRVAVGAGVAVFGALLVALVVSLGARAEQERQLYIASIAAASASTEESPETMRRNLARAPAELRRWEWEHLTARIDDSIGTLDRVEGRIWDLALDGAGQRLALATGQGPLVVLDLSSPGRRWTVDTGDGSLRLVAVHPSGEELLSAREQTVQRWSLGAELEPLSTWYGKDNVTSLVHDPGEERVFVGLRNGIVHCLDEDLRRERFILGGHGGWVMSLVVSPDGKRLYTGDAEGTLRCFDLASRSVTWDGAHAGEIWCLASDRSGRLLASGGEDETVRLWDADSGEAREVFRGHTGIVTDVRFSPDDGLLVSSSFDRSVRVWDPVRLQPVRTLRGHDGQLDGVVFRPDGRLLTGDRFGIVKEWDPRVNGGGVVLDGHLADVWALAFDAGGERLLSLSRDGLRLWDAVTGNVLRVLMGSRGTPRGAAWVHGDTRILSIYWDGVLRLWDAASGEVETEWQLPVTEEGPTRMSWLAAHPDGERFFALDLGEAVVSFECREDGFSFRGRKPFLGVESIAISPDGGFLALGTIRGSVLLVDAETLRPLTERDGHVGVVRHLAFHPDGKSWLSGGDDGVVRSWSVPAGDLLRTIDVEPQGARAGVAIQGLAIDPSGTRLVTASPGQGTVLWDLEREELLMRLRGPGRGHSCAAISPDAGRVASGSWVGLIRVWDSLPVREHRERLARQASRELEARELVDRLTRDAADLDQVKQVIRSETRDVELRETALRLAHEDSGRFEGFLARTRQLLRGPHPELPRVREAHVLAHGLAKEHHEDPHVQRVLGEVYLRLGRLEEARVSLEFVLSAFEQTAESAAETHALLATVHARQDRLAEARVALELARAGKPSGDAGFEALLREATELVER